MMHAAFATIVIFHRIIVIYIMATWFIDVMPLTGEFVTRKADDALSFEEIQNQLVESLYEFPLLFSFRLRDGTVVETDDREEFLKKGRWPVLCLPSEEGAQTIADWLNKIMPNSPLPWNNEDAKRFQIAMESISLSMKVLSKFK